MKHQHLPSSKEERNSEREEEMEGEDNQ